MSHGLSCFLVVFLVAALSCVGGAASAQNDVIGHVIAGYQGWFSSPGDGSSVGSAPPGTGNYHDNFETLPDLREFPDAERFAPAKPRGVLPNGNSAKVFSSARAFTTEKHVEWMKQYGVEVAAIQRFYEVTRGDRNAQQKDLVTRLLRDACQRHGRKFYIEYDASGSGKTSIIWAEAFKKDWLRFAVGENIIDSPAYARQNGKPVVELWGIGLNSNNISTDPAQWLDLVQWFKNQGCYVIGGVPTGWAGNGGYHDTLPGFARVYAACDALSPWVVGRFSTKEGADKYAQSNLVPERDWCKTQKIDYIPCVFPGTSFFNSNPTRAKNIIPRQGGQLMWRQFANLRNAGIGTCFISMFDEFNEATEIVKTAENAGQVPTTGWFLTLDADGADLSSDFYLRLTRDGGAMLKGETSLQWEMPTPPRNDLFATSFESGDPPLTWGNSPDTVYNKSPHNVHGLSADTGPQCEIRSDSHVQSGRAALQISGRANGGDATYCYYRLFDLSAAPKTITRDTILYYWIYPENDNARYIAVDFHFTDGTMLSDIMCVDQNGNSLRPSKGHGGRIPLNTWSVITSNLGALAGKKIDKIWIVFDRVGATGPYQGSIDDIRLSH